MRLENLEKIVLAAGGLEALRSGVALKIENKPFLPLSIEHIGLSLLGSDEISVCHYGEQNGDLMRDPDMTFVAIEMADGSIDWLPASYRNDYLGVFQECLRIKNGEAYVDPQAVESLTQMAVLWDSNLGSQGFVKQAVGV